MTCQKHIPAISHAMDTRSQDRGIKYKCHLRMFSSCVHTNIHTTHKLTDLSALLAASHKQHSTNQPPTPAPLNPVVQQWKTLSVTQPPTCSIHKLGIIQTRATHTKKNQNQFHMAAKHAQALSSPALYTCKQ